MRCLDPTEDAPAAVAAHHELGHFRDAEAIAKFAATCDVLTVEIEHIDADALERAARASGVDVEPTPNTIRIIQVRVRLRLRSRLVGGFGVGCPPVLGPWLGRWLAVVCVQF